MASVNSYRFLFAVLAAVAVSPSAAAGLGTEGAARPHLTLADESPLVVTGRGFRAGERVRVVASAARGRYRKTVSVSSRGRFTVRFASTDASCGPLLVTALGAEGNRASWRRVGIPPPCGADPG